MVTKVNLKTFKAVCEGEETDLIEIDLERGPKRPEGVWQFSNCCREWLSSLKTIHAENHFHSIWFHLVVFGFISSPTDLDSTHRRIEIISILIVILIMAPPPGGGIKLWLPRYIGIFTKVCLVCDLRGL